MAGISVDRVYDMVEIGRYLWVWNVSSGVGNRRELRFWSREVNDPASVAGLTIDDVLKTVVPKRAHVPGQRDGLRNWEFRHLLRLSKPSLCELRKELGVRGTTRNLFIPRANLERFLRRRWVGNICSRDSSGNNQQKAATKKHRAKSKSK